MANIICNQFQKKYVSKFKMDYTFEQRLNESKRAMKEHTNKIPIILEKNQSCRQLQELTKYKTLAPHDLKVGQLIIFIREQIRLEPTIAIFITFNGNSYNHNTSISQIYESEVDKDGFLYAIYSLENVFGK